MILLAAFLAGLLAWSLAEYAVHRWVLHRRGWFFWREHMKHHREPLAEVGVALHYAAPLAGLLIFNAFAFFGATTGAFAVGATVGYVAYVSMHEAMHRCWWFSSPAHDLHHAGGPVNYGVTSPLWDIVFGTYKRA